MLFSTHLNLRLVKYILFISILFCSYAKAQEITYEYDNINRIVEVTYDSVIINIQYDSVGNPISRIFTINTSVPVELLSFTAWPETENGDNKSQLEWKTASEKNTESFIVEWSVDGHNWSAIDTVAAVGNSVEEQTYRITHYDPAFGNNYYRLYILDFDGTYEYSNVAVVTFDKDISFSMNMYPNPTKDEMHISFFGNNDFEFKAVYDMAGKEFTGIPHNRNSASEWTLNLSSLPKGAYIVAFENGDMRVTRLFTKQN